MINECLEKLKMEPKLTLSEFPDGSTDAVLFEELQAVVKELQARVEGHVVVAAIFRVVLVEALLSGCKASN